MRSLLLLLLLLCPALAGCVTTSMAEAFFDEGPGGMTVKDTPYEVTAAHRLGDEVALTIRCRTGETSVVCARDGVRGGPQALPLERHGGEPLLLVDELPAAPPSGPGRVRRRIERGVVELQDAAGTWRVRLQERRSSAPLATRIAGFVVILPFALALDVVTAPVQGLFLDDDDDDDDCE